jgi:pimeloyl-ACP methyl ester carboxylesterase
MAEIHRFPPSFRIEEIKTDGATIHVRVGGEGQAVVMLHGFGDTGDMWAPLAAALVHDYTIVAPDLRGMGLSSDPEDGYDKKTQSGDVARVLDKLKIEKADLVTHDIGNMVGYAFAAQYPDRVTRWVAMDAPLPGIGPWDEIIRSPALWHFNFRGPDVERLVKGRERIYLDRFWNELSANPRSIDEATRQHYAELYARPGAMHSAFNQFAAFTQDAIDNQAFAAKGKLTTPVLAIGAEKSFGTAMADDLRFIATDVASVVISNSGHWLMEEQPAATVAAIRAFLDKQQQ